jgi:hypothetical protein
MTRPSDRLWLSAILSWVAMVAAIMVAAGAEWLANGPRDPDIHHWTEFVFLVVMVASIPLLLISIGVFLPLMLAFERLGGWRSSRAVNGVVGAALVLPAVAVIAAVSTLLGWHIRGPVPLWWALLLAFGGLVFGLSTPTSRTTLTNAPNATNLTH